MILLIDGLFVGGFFAFRSTPRILDLLNPSGNYN